MKHLITVIAILMVSLTAAMAQTTTSVEKAVRFRATQNNDVVKTNSVSMQIKTDVQQASIEVSSLQHLSSSQLEESGAFIWNSNALQLKELGAFPWNRNVLQLKELGGFLWNDNAINLQELGGFVWNDNAINLQELGGFVWNDNSTQLKELGAGRKF